MPAMSTASGYSGYSVRHYEYNERKLVIITIFALILCFPLGLIGLLFFLRADDLNHRDGRTDDENEYLR